MTEWIEGCYTISRKMTGSLLEVQNIKIKNKKSKGKSMWLLSQNFSG